MPSDDSAIAELLARSERVLGLRLCFHDRSLPRGFPMRWCEHADPACLAVKRHHQRHCAAWCGLRVERDMAADPRVRISTCPYGHSEIIAPLRPQHPLPGVLYAGCWWTGSADPPRPQLLPEPHPGFLHDRLGLVAALALHLGALLGDTGGEDRRHDEILAFLHRHRQRMPRLGELAEHLDLSPSRCGHVVQELFAMTYPDLVHTVKLRDAAHYLAVSHLPILDIALRFGYADQSHFTRRFTARYGCTPLTWRRRQAGGGMV